MAEKIIRAVVQAVSIPVTVKMRTGWDDHSFVAPELAKRAEAAGAAAVAVHGRTREQFYSGKADWQKIKPSSTPYPSGHREWGCHRRAVCSRHDERNGMPGRYGRPRRSRKSLDFPTNTPLS